MDIASFTTEIFLRWIFLGVAGALAVWLAGCVIGITATIHTALAIAAQTTSTTANKTFATTYDNIQLKV